MWSPWMRRAAGLVGLLWVLAPLSTWAGPDGNPPAWSSVNEAALDARRGGVSRGATARADVSDNRVGDDVTTGGVVVSGSFSGSRGITSNIVNTGNNVSIQSTLRVVVELH